MGSRLIDVCQDGSWSYEEHCSDPHVVYDSTASGGWDVYCDSDGDGLLNSEDNCPTIANSDQSDTDGDCIGDVCDEFPEIYDLTQPDTDSDNIGDACDSCPNDPENDADSDGMCEDVDNFLNNSNPGQEDLRPPQGNGIGDACDCEGDFDCDGDCDGTDAATFKIDFGRSLFDNTHVLMNPQCKGY